VRYADWKSLDIAKDWYLASLLTWIVTMKYDAGLTGFVIPKMSDVPAQLKDLPDKLGMSLYDGRWSNEYAGSWTMAELEENMPFDCDDTDDSVNPGIVEDDMCNLVNDDCDDEVDECSDWVEREDDVSSDVAVKKDKVVGPDFGFMPGIGGGAVVGPVPEQKIVTETGRNEITGRGIEGVVEGVGTALGGIIEEGVETAGEIADQLVGEDEVTFTDLPQHCVDDSDCSGGEVCSMADNTCKLPVVSDTEEDSPFLIEHEMINSESDDDSSPGFDIAMMEAIFLDVPKHKSRSCVYRVKPGSGGNWGCQVWDFDGDGYMNKSFGCPTCTDCDDSDIEVNPAMDDCLRGGDDTCDSKDNNCNGLPDEMKNDDTDTMPNEYDLCDSEGTSVGPVDYNGCWYSVGLGHDNLENWGPG
jgi:hypothetical protein